MSSSSSMSDDTEVVFRDITVFTSVEELENTIREGRKPNAKTDNPIAYNIFMNSIVAPRKSKDAVPELTELSPRLDLPDFRSFGLMEYQKIAFAAIILLQRFSYDVYVEGSKDPLIVKTNICTLQLPLGSGKTVVTAMVATIANRESPRDTYYLPNITKTTFNISSSAGITHTTIKVPRNKILPLTIGLCNANLVRTTWDGDTFGKFNFPFTPLLIEDVNQFIAFLEKLLTEEGIKELCVHRLVMIALMDIPSDKLMRTISNKNNMNMTTFEYTTLVPASVALSVVLNNSGYVVRQLILDDFDTFSKPAALPPSIYTLLISTTAKTQAPPSSGQYWDTTEEFMLSIPGKYPIIPVKQLLISPSISQNSIKVKKEVVDSCVMLKPPIALVYTVVDPNAKSKRVILALIPADKVKEIQEQMAGDFIGGAAQIKGGKNVIKSFSQLASEFLGERVTEYNYQKDLLDKCKEFIETLKRRKGTEPWGDRTLYPIVGVPEENIPPYTGYKYYDPMTNKEIIYREYNQETNSISIPQRLTEKLIYNIPPEKIIYEFIDWKTDIRAIMAKAKDRFEELSKDMNKIREAFMDLRCPICKQQVQGNRAFFPCCHSNICEGCYKDYVNKQQRKQYEFYNEQRRVDDVKCPSCTKVVNLQELKFVPGSLTNEKVAEESQKRLNIVEDQISNDELEIEIQNRFSSKSKLEIVQSICSKDPYVFLESTVFAKRIVLDITNRLLIGATCKKKESLTPLNERKYIIVANYTPIFEGVLNSDLKKEIIILSGSASDKQRILEEFRKPNGPRIMLLNSVSDCSGLNIQCASDIIFTHQINNRTILEQTMARIHRLGGGNHNKRIHIIHYNDEPIVGTDEKANIGTMNRINDKQDSNNYFSEDSKFILINGNTPEMRKHKNNAISTIKEIREGKSEYLSNTHMCVIKGPTTSVEMSDDSDSSKSSPSPSPRLEEKKEDFPPKKNVVKEREPRPHIQQQNQNAYIGNPPQPQQNQIPRPPAPQQMNQHNLFNGARAVQAVQMRDEDDGEIEPHIEQIDDGDNDGGIEPHIEQINDGGNILTAEEQKQINNEILLDPYGNKLKVDRDFGLTYYVEQGKNDIAENRIFISFMTKEKIDELYRGKKRR